VAVEYKMKNYFIAYRRYRRNEILINY